MPAVATPPAFEPPPGNRRFPLIDALRAVAALSVLVYHVDLAVGSRPALHPVLGNLNVGVAIFFAISGFLLYRPFVAARLELAPPVATRDYLVRRALRIVPAYWVALTVLAIYPGLDGVFSADWWHFYGFAQIYFDGQEFAGLPAAWSLCTEVTFYAFLPVYAALVARMRLSWTAEIALLLALGAVSLAIRVPVSEALTGGLPMSLPALFFWFVPGMGFALLTCREKPPRISGWAYLATAVAGLALAAYGPDTDDWIFVGFTLVATGLIAAAVLPTAGGGGAERVLGWAPLAWLGLISYGIYLYHQPIVLEAREQLERGFGPVLIVALVGAVALGAASYYVVERPILKLKPGRTRAPRP